ncbi:hypothetical protein [Chitinophaga cymbidii]|uniref:Uncharacterized protein n=1 Tax=Chitinophaga cymbidii TaxID=1096750 RepID=A0A512RIN3_9BACT|nr:hypothetical protein [Chitinophaga cymbidii]GEP95563.1 hypothetical protein CCY01nite_18230 [Chitinophaga cymbidii]
MVRSTVIVEGYAVDLIEDVATDFTFSIQDIRTPDKRNTGYSKDIELPGTPKNNALFAHIFSVNSENDWTADQPNIGYNFNPNKVAKALVLVDGIQVFRGVIRVSRITIRDGEIKYHTNVIGRLSDILFSMGDKKLGDIDFSDMEHDLSPAHLQDVWNNPQNYRYTYPMIDYGYSTDGRHYPIQNFAPAIYVKEYIDRMFADAGFTYNCPFFLSPYFQALIIPVSHKFEFTAPANKVKYLELRSINQNLENNRSGNNWRFVTIPFATETLDKYGWHVGANHDIVITQTTEVSFQFDLNFTYNNSKGRAAEVFVLLNNDHGNRLVVETVPANAIYRKTIEISKRKWVTGSRITIGVNMPPKGRVFFNTLSRWYAPSPTDDSTYPLDVGIPVDMSGMVSKDIAQKDFFKSILLMHNLYVFTDENNDRNLFIVPQAWFYNNFAGDAVDWTYKLAHDQQQEIIPMGELAAREYLLTYKKDTDYYNDQRYFQIYGEIYGQKQAIADNDFEKDTQKIELIFSPSPPVQNEGNTRVMPHLYKVDQNEVKQRDAFNIRILLYGGLKPSKTGFGYADPSAPWILTDLYGNDLASYSQYPYAGMWDDPVARSRDLCFGPPQETFYTYPDGTYPDVGLYRFWWEGFISEITNKDSKLFRAMFRLTPNDINQLDFKRLVKVDNTYYKLNKVFEFKPLSSELTKVELFKSSVAVEVERPGFLKWSDEGYLLHSDESPARIPLA